jgi:hypothetical protein
MSRSSRNFCEHALNVQIQRLASLLAGKVDPEMHFAFSQRAIFSGRGRLGPGNCSRAACKNESADKPGSVLDSHSSGVRVAAQLKRPTRKPMWATCSSDYAARFPIWSCSRWGLPCRWCCHPRGALLPHHFTLTGAACAALRRYLSVALSVGSRLPGVTWHRALKEPGLSSMCECTQRLSGRLGVHHTQVRALMRGGLRLED